MDENIAFILESAEEAMGQSIEHLSKELRKIRAGKANPIMLEGVRPEYYGAQTPINQLASITAPDGRTLQVQPFDKGSITAIEKAIRDANLGFNPQNDGNRIIIPVPMLTEERRKGLFRQAKDEGENAKISIRNARRDHMDQLKGLKDEGVSEDEIKRGEEEVDKVTKKFSAQVDEVLKKKEEEIMTV